MKKDWNYKFLLFDADRTILDFDKTEEIALKQTFSEFRIDLNDETREQYVQINKQLWLEHELGKITRERLIYKRFEDLFSMKQIEEDPIEFEERYQFWLSETHCVIDGALELVRDLSKQYEVYIVTNGVKMTQLKRINQSGFAKYISGHFISEEVGYQKPSKEFFDVVFDNIPHFDKSKAIIIGDSLSSDIKGGNQAGIDTCWYNPFHELNTLDVTVTHEIYNLEELRIALL